MSEKSVKVGDLVMSPYPNRGLGLVIESYDHPFYGQCARVRWMKSTAPRVVGKITVDLLEIVSISKKSA